MKCKKTTKTGSFFYKKQHYELSLYKNRAYGIILPAYMGKECWQLKFGPTPCFIAAGRRPCLADDCLVEKRTKDLEAKGINVDRVWLNGLLHSRCRLSSLSLENTEYKERTR